MKLVLFLGAFLLAGLASAAPTTEDDDTVIITEQVFIADFAKYTSEHDIVELVLPLNNLNFNDDDDDDDSEDTNDTNATLFFVEADTDDQGKRIDKGLYVMKHYNVTKLLDNGRDASAGNENNTFVYFGAKDGIYVYDAEKNKADKYGSVTDSIISIAKVNGSDIIYILTEDHVLYKVTEAGTKKTKVDEVVNAQKLVLDFGNSLFYYTVDKEVYVLTSDGVKKIEGLPAPATYVNILKPSFVIETGVPIIVNDKAYIAHVNGTFETTDFQFVVKPTAFAMEGTLVQYYAYNKKIYEYNILEIIASEFQNEIKSFLDDKSDKIESIATRSMSNLIPDEEATTAKSE